MNPLTTNNYSLSCMSLASRIKSELSKLGIRPKKGLGQNFLINEGVYEKITDIAQVRPSDIIIEVGAGLGILTEHLAMASRRVIAVEKDCTLAAYLKNHFKDNPGIKVVEDDILKFHPAGYGLTEDNYKLIGNIPYYLTSHLIKIIFDSPAGEWPSPKLIVFMVQKEVAQRIVAKPPKMSLLSVSAQFYSKIDIAAKVSRHSFYPAPKVDSAIIRLTPKTKSLRLSKDFAAKFFRIVKAGFAGKRKQILNTLSRSLKLSKDEIGLKLLSLGITVQRRPETLTVEEWQEITKIF